MLPEAGATELIFLAIVALIVVGPKDLPVLLRRVGQFTAKMRGLAAEFRSSFDELARQSELDELRKEVDALRHGTYVAPVQKEIEQHFTDLHSEFGAAAPPPLTEEGVILPGPQAVEGTVPASPAAVMRPLAPTHPAEPAHVADPPLVEPAPQPALAVSAEAGERNG